MSRNIDQLEKMRIAAEKIKLKKEKEAREDREFYEKITSGVQWLFFKIVVAFCSIIFVISVVETFVDGPTKKLPETAWKIDREWDYTWHKVLDVEGYMFTPTIADWSIRVENTLEMTYSPIFKTGKKLKYQMKVSENITRTQENMRQRSYFNWFPFFQIFLLIPLLTFIFKRQSAWFNFARVFSLVFVLSGTLIVIFYSML
jgi:hypothetical protein